MRKLGVLDLGDKLAQIDRKLQSLNAIVIEKLKQATAFEYVKICV